MSRILVVEDDPSILRGLVDNLKFESYDVLAARDGASALELARMHRPDLVILDLMLPGMSGYEVCQALRRSGSEIPILMLTARREESDRVFGLDLGADDYVSKPFSMRELLARIRALLRRTSASAPPDVLRFDDVEIDFDKYEARKAGEALEMTRKEFGLMRMLSSRPGTVISRDEILTEVWGFDHLPTTRTVDNHIASLRAKLESNAANPSRIVTVHGVGYKLVI